MLRGYIISGQEWRPGDVSDYVKEADLNLNKGKHVR